MTVRLRRLTPPHVSLGPTLTEAGRRRRSGISLLGLGIRSLVVGMVLGLLATWHDGSSPAATLVLGGAVVAWAVLSFADERPGS